MDGSWSILTRWAIWPSALSALLGFVAFAVVLTPAERLSGRRGRSRPGAGPLSPGAR